MCEYNSPENEIESVGGTGYYCVFDRNKDVYVLVYGYSFFRNNMDDKIKNFIKCHEKCDKRQVYCIEDGEIVVEDTNCWMVNHI